MEVHPVDQAAAVSLLQLPDPCLLTVLRCCADDLRSVCSAARAHSRLHQAAVLALNKITSEITQKQLDSLMGIYLPSHGQHVDSISLQVEDWSDEAAAVTVRQLPQTLHKLSSLEFWNLRVQLQPGDGFQGVLSAAAPPALKQLQLIGCTLLDGEEGLAATLALLPGLPGLEYLCIMESYDRENQEIHVPLCLIAPALQQLTYLQLWEAWDPDDKLEAALQHLTALTRLVDLRLALRGPCTFSTSMLSGAQHLTCLQLDAQSQEVFVDPAALAGKTKLQQLDLCKPLGGTAGTAQLLCELQQLQQLTRLSLCSSLFPTLAYPPVAAYSALTASSKLQRLDIAYCSFPAGVWQHVFPAGRQLPHLQWLRIAGVTFPTGPAVAPDSSSIVSCCPGLQDLNMEGLQYRIGMLDGLHGLSSLHRLNLQPAASSIEGWSEGICWLTGLKDLWLVEVRGEGEGLLLQLTELRQLTRLHFRRLDLAAMSSCGYFSGESADGGEPVWRQVLRLHLDHSDPEVAQHAAAALAE